MDHGFLVPLHHIERPVNGAGTGIGTLGEIAGGAYPPAHGGECPAVGTTGRHAGEDRQAPLAGGMVPPPVLRPQEREARPAGSQPALAV